MKYLHSDAVYVPEGEKDNTQINVMKKKRAGSQKMRQSGCSKKISNKVTSEQKLESKVEPSLGAV